MKRVFKAALLLTLLCAPAFSRQAPAAARVVDAFGEIQWSDLMARLDNFAVELQKAPGARGVVVAYSAKHKFPGWPLRRAYAAVDYLINMRGIDAARISAVNAGLRGDVGFELWVVPPGAEWPLKPFDASLLMSGEKSAVLFDRFAVAEREEDMSAYGLEPRPDSPGVYEYFAEVLRSDPSLRGYVIGYAARRGSLKSARRIASRGKLTIAKSHAIDVGRVVALGGGRLNYKMMELWLVPPGAEPPKPTPPARAHTRRRPRR